MTKKQIGKRFLQILIVLFGISFLTFGLTYLSPGDPAEIMLTECGNLPTPELLEQTRHELGLDQPFLVQYGTWLKGVLTGDMGQSYSFKMPVVQKLVSCFWPTLKMSLLALLMMIVISIPLGILAAVYQNKFPDYFVRGITFIGVSVPSFWLGLILLSIFGVQLRWVNVAGGSTDFKAMVLPALTLALAMSAKYTRQVRSAVLEELHQDYVTGARMDFPWEVFLAVLQSLRLSTTGRVWEIWQSKQSPAVIIRWFRDMYCGSLFCICVSICLWICPILIWIQDLRRIDN